MNRNAIQLKVAAALFALFAAGQASAAGTAADTLISNTATASYNIGASSQSTSSTVDFRVDEVVSVNVTTVATATPVTTTSTPPGNTAKRVSYDIANVGNGTEDYTVVVDPAQSTDPNGGTPGTDQFNPTYVRSFIDVNGNGTYESGTDTLFDPNTDTLTLAADQTVRYVVESNIPTLQQDGVTSVADGDIGFVVLKVDSDTFAVGAAQGTVAVGAGTSPSSSTIDAVADQAGASATAYYLVTTVNVTITKTIDSVSDPFGGTQRIPGAIVTYRITVVVDGSGTASSLVINDNIAPATGGAGLGYVEDSVILDSVGQSDAVDADATQVTFTNTAEASDASTVAVGGVSIAVNLGNVTVTGGTTTYTITLQAEIQ